MIRDQNVLNRLSLPVKSLHFLFLILLVSCGKNQQEAKEANPGSQPADDSPAATMPDLRFASLPVLPNYSTKILTGEGNESTIGSGLFPLLEEYGRQKYFSIQTGEKSWYLDQQGRLWIFTEERENEIINTRSVYLFRQDTLIAGYSDTDTRGQDSQRLRERILTKECPTCGVTFDLTSSEVLVHVVDSTRVIQLADYFTTEYRGILNWLAQAPVATTEGNDLIFEKGEPSKATYRVNKELYEKFIQRKND
ncbi:MAG: hypothetical protein JNL17_13320 [Cyclobacteriaceae bacterium]|nr:hypothetical protein [Cyclobacteriaceae bacterium]